WAAAPSTPIRSTAAASTRQAISLMASPFECAHRRARSMSDARSVHASARRRWGRAGDRGGPLRGERRGTAAGPTVARRRKISGPMPPVSRRLFIVSLAALVHPRMARAQPAGKTARVAVLASGTEGNFAPSVAVFREALAKAGWIEGQNLTLDVRYAG